LHAKDIQRLAAHVLCAHVYGAGQAEQRANCGGRHAVLASAGFGNDAALAHATRQQNLPECIVNFVSAGVQQIFPFQIHARAVRMFGQPLRKKERRGTARIIL